MRHVREVRKVRAVLTCEVRQVLRCGAARRRTSDILQCREAKNANRSCSSCFVHRMAKHFSELICYQLGRQLRQEIFGLTTQPTFDQDLRFRGQLRDAASSVCSNISEGFGRSTHRDFARFLDMSRSSVNEIENRLGESVERKYLKAAEIDKALNLGKRTRVATSRLMAYLKRTPD